MDQYSDYLNPSDSAGQPVQGQQQPQTPTPSTGGTKTGLMDQWNDFMSEPANRAGLMQFGINMLAGQGLAGGLGGFGEASTRNLAAQEEEEKQAEEESLKERAQATKESEAQSYGIMARKKSSQDAYYEHAMLQDRLQGQRSANTKYQSWLGTTDPTGGDTRWNALQKQFPGLKDKSQLLSPSDPIGRQAADAARRSFLREEGADGGGGGGGGFQPPQGAIPRRDRRTGNTIYYDPNTKEPYPGQI